MSGLLIQPTDVEDMLRCIAVEPAGTVTVSASFLVDLCNRLIELESLTAPLRRHVQPDYGYEGWTGW